MKAIILAAGVGSRLGKPFPKALSQLPSGETIMGRQIRILRENGLSEIIVVVGFKMALLMEHFPSVLYKYNPEFYLTNTSKSLLCALEHVEREDALWVNGDVVFDPQIIADMIARGGNVVAVDKKKCAEEEVKYRTDHRGGIVEISKTVSEPEGEALGINTIGAHHLEVFRQALRECGDKDYFEKAMELVIERGVTFVPMDVSDYRCIEVDFEEDLQNARQLFAV
ncbi:phosphocholine cytidylyltransferase family protein [Solidesulfovibrio carbinolicus]|uniref:UDP-N-acetylglucosamine pyrophosphorylase n=2 Tax=Solidesulfovibrio TaxID=2910984 RepID=A0A4P6HQQ7_9BACT|nr:phosphocholine cytidylyltransferase family protein [Solidesulfovibrio carbinolicus]QAZ69653.1 UDP-N-acetylglucosamine pyrophosphorylase [Solidesulfovibrio carbinolicus]